MSLEHLDLTPLQVQTCVLYYGCGMRMEAIASAQGRGWRRVQRSLNAARRKYPGLARRYNRRDFDPFADAP